MTPKQTQFVKEYLIDLNATQAAIRAGYSPKRARQTGADNVAKRDIQAAIAKAQEARSERVEISADNVLKELALVGFSDIGNYFAFDDQGNACTDFSRMTPEQRRAIESIQQEEALEAEGSGEGAEVRRVRKTRLKLHSKLDALEKIARHLGMYAADNSRKLEMDVTLKVQQALQKVQQMTPEERRERLAELESR